MSDRMTDVQELIDLVGALEIINKQPVHISISSAKESFEDHSVQMIKRTIYDVLDDTAEARTRLMGGE